MALKTYILSSLAMVFIDADLPEQTLIYTNWFHCDSLATYYKVPVFSDEFWKITENFIKTAAEHGMNLILTPLFTPPLDTKWELKELLFSWLMSRKQKQAMNSVLTI